MARGIQSISLGFRLLKAITDSEAPVSLKSIAAAGGMSPSKARMYLISLIETGLIVQNAETALYSLGPYAMHLGTRAMQRMEVMQVATESMRWLQQQTGAVALLCTWEESGIVVVSILEGGSPMPLQFRMGGSASLASTATGHVFLAYGPQKPVWERLAKEIELSGFSKTEQRQITRDLHKTAEQVREQRLAEADPIVYATGVSLSGYAAAAAPIFDASKQLRYVLTLMYRVESRPRKKAEMLRLTLEAATRGSILAGGGSV
ncbi:MAG: helix-turn-helix domain-containing protein [Gammaproteobacteria bacterium]